MSNRVYIIFSRHGHRAPARNIFKSQIEYDMWKGLLPSLLQLSRLGDKYPIVSYPENSKQKDLQTYPFGCITRKGIEHMTAVGENIVKLFPVLSKPTYVEASATNYQRTQVSAQALLSGMNISSAKIEVKDPALCPMSFYEGQSEIANKMLFMVRQQLSFQLHEMDMTEVRTTLLKHLPGIVLKELEGDPTVVWQKSLGWLTAADYFVCRRTHGIAIPNQELADQEAAILKYLPERYNLYYGHKLHLAHFTAPMLSSVLSTIQSLSPSICNNNTGENGATIHLMSGHDVNLLGLLHALKADIVYPKNTDYWPDFGDTLIFEAYHDETFSGGQSKDLSDVYINFYLNLKPLDININNNKDDDDNDEKKNKGYKTNRVKYSELVNILEDIEDRIEESF